MPPQFNFVYNVDIVMCIDATASMGPIIDKVKSTALELPGLFLAKMEEANKHCDNVRFKVINFRDYKWDDEPMSESRFFTMEDSTEFQDYVNSITPDGGGDIPENALEALAYAIKSDWVTTGNKKRHVILMFTDAPALKLRERGDLPAYPSDMPSDLVELIDWYEGRAEQDKGIKLDQDAKRLVLFTPHAEPWEDLKDLPTVILKPITADGGGEELDMGAIISLLVNSL